MDTKRYRVGRIHHSTDRAVESRVEELPESEEADGLSYGDAVRLFDRTPASDTELVSVSIYQLRDPAFGGDGGFRLVLTK